jgi:hypothetical protein
MALFVSLQVGSCVDRLAGLSGSEVIGDADQVTISGKAAFDSLVWAVAHCDQYGRSAQLVAQMRDGAQYKCVKSG